MAWDTIPPELQSIICDYIFSETTSDKAIDILSRRVPADVAIRSVSKELLVASKFSYERASDDANIKRQAILHDITSSYKNIEPHVPLVTTNNLCLLAANLTSTTANAISCKHACAKQGCYMCSDPAHRRCFECGRNLAIALWCKMPTEARSTSGSPTTHAPPPLLQPAVNGGSPKPTDTGHLISRLGVKNYVPPRDQFGRTPWAFKWWMCQYFTQLAIELRCNIRRYAIKQYFRESSSAVMDEFRVVALERSDRRRMEKYKKIKRHIGAGHIEWRGEYERRARLEADEAGHF